MNAYNVQQQRRKFYLPDTPENINIVSVNTLCFTSFAVALSAF